MRPIINNAMMPTAISMYSAELVKAISHVPDLGDRKEGLDLKKLVNGVHKQYAAVSPSNDDAAPRVHPASSAEPPRSGGQYAARAHTAGDAGDRVPQPGTAAARNGRTSCAAFRRGLAEAGYVEGQNVAIEYRSAEDRYRSAAQPWQPSLDGPQDLAVIAAGNLQRPHSRRKAATTTIPDRLPHPPSDPVRPRPRHQPRPARRQSHRGQYVANELEAKRLHLLHQLVPQVRRIAVLVNPDSVIYAETTLRDVEAAARTIGLQLQVLKTKSAREIEEGFVMERTAEAGTPRRSRSLLERPACATGAIGGLSPPARHLRAARSGGSRRTDELRTQHPRGLPSSGEIPAVYSRARSLETCRSCSRPKFESGCQR